MNKSHRYHSFYKYYRIMHRRRIMPFIADEVEFDTNYPAHTANRQYLLGTTTITH